MAGVMFQPGGQYGARTGYNELHRPPSGSGKAGVSGAYSPTQEAAVHLAQPAPSLPVPASQSSQPQTFTLPPDFYSAMAQLSAPTPIPTLPPLQMPPMPTYAPPPPYVPPPPPPQTRVTPPSVYLDPNRTGTLQEAQQYIQRLTPRPITDAEWQQLATLVGYQGGQVTGAQVNQALDIIAKELGLAFQ